MAASFFKVQGTRRLFRFVQYTERKQNGTEKEKTEYKKTESGDVGGLSEIGKNLAVIEYENEMIVVDCGIGFPDDEMPGVDLVLPDFTYLKENADKLKGVFITHGDRKSVV